MRKRMTVWVGAMLCALAAWSSAAAAGPRVELAWPTPGNAWAEGRPAREFLQHAGSGDPESGGFGGVRSGGRQFHEGIDIKPSARDRQGEPTDPVFAAMDGVVRHVSAVAGRSSYGRYLVLEHPGVSPAVYTLYAHLARIDPSVRVGASVRRGQVLGTMGHTAGGYTIPRDRAHLHFEIGLRVTDDFQAWYDSRKFGSRNDHGLWNGMNLMGIDPLDFLEAWRARRVNNFDEYFAEMPVAVRLKIATRRVPDFVRRYPSLVTKPLPMIVGGWEISFNWSGIPFRWTPLSGAETAGMTLNRAEIVEVNPSETRRDRSKALVAQARGVWRPVDDLNTVLQQLGLR
ncbi:MAG TPA: M23 family metallopeptidase [Opitutus sp.]|nr:M23 family metallopeptidase [Opitutus sp.]